jgi:EmrB/QacA subfamily drug resistance transporter
LGDRFGRRRLFAAGLLLFVAASAACALATSVGWLIAARAVQGMGAALVMPLALALLTAAFPPARRGRALGVFAALTGVAVAGGPLVGGAITQGLAWQWIFWLNVPIGLAVVPLVRANIEESRGPRTSMDPVGLALTSGGALGLVWGLVRGNAAGWASPEVVGTLAAGTALTLAFVLWELRVDEPMLPMRFFRNRAFAAGNASAFLLGAGLFSAVFFISQYLQTSLGYGPLAAGLRTMPWSAAIFFVAPAAGALADRVGSRALIALGLLLQAAGFGWIALNAEHGVGYGASVAALVLAGTGVSMALPAAQNATMGSVDRAAIGKASGTFTTMRQLGAGFGVAVTAAAFAARGGYGSPTSFGHGAAAAIGLAAAMSLAGSLVGLLAPGRRAVAAARPLPAREPVLVGEAGTSAEA